MASGCTNRSKDASILDTLLGRLPNASVPRGEFCSQRETGSSSRGTGRGGTGGRARTWRGNTENDEGGAGGPTAGSVSLWPSPRSRRESRCPSTRPRSRPPCLAWTWRWVTSESSFFAPPSPSSSLPSSPLLAAPGLADVVSRGRPDRMARVRRLCPVGRSTRHSRC